LPQSPQALLVDIHDRHEAWALDARIDELIHIERFQANNLNRPRIQDPEREQAHEKQEADDPACPQASYLIQNGRHDCRPAGAWPFRKNLAS
jgi:hypothetical protein